MDKLIKKPFMGLVMGNSRSYWVDIIETISSISGSYPFLWNHIIDSTNSRIDKSALTRLKCSNWIYIAEKRRRVTTWKVHPDAIELLNEYNIRKKIKTNRLQN